MDHIKDNSGMSLYTAERRTTMSKLRNIFPWRINKLFFRIFSYFAALLIPVLLIGGIYYFHLLYVEKEELSEKIARNLSASTQTLDIYLQMAQEVSTNFFHDESIRRLLLPYDQLTLSEKAEIAVIPRVLSNNTYLLGHFVDHVFVVADEHKVYTRNGGEDFNAFFDKFYPYERYSREFWSTKLIEQKPFEILPVSRILNSGKGRVIPFAATDLIRGNPSLIVVNVSTDFILEKLEELSLFPTTRYVVVDHHGEVVVSTLGASVAGDPSFTQSLMQKSYSVTSIRSDKFDWTFYSYTPEVEFRQEASKILPLIISICLLLLLFGFVLAIYFSSTLYAPIRKIRNVLVNQEIGQEMGTSLKRRDEFEIIDDRIHTLLQYNNNFQHKIRVISEEYFEQIFSQWIQGIEIANGAEFHEQIVERFGFHKPYFVCSMIRFHFKKAFYKDIQDVDRLLILGRLKNIIDGLLNAHANSYVFDYKEYSFISISNIDRDEEQKIAEGLREIIGTFEYDSGYCTVNIGIGKMYNGINDISKSFNDAMTVISAADEDDKNSTISDSATLEIHNRYLYSLIDENKLLNYVKSADMASLELTLDDIIQRNRDNGVSYHFLALLIADLYKTGLRLSAEIGIDFNLLLDETGHNKLIGKTSKSLDFKEQYELLLQFYQRLVDHFRADPDQKQDDFVPALLTYIQSNYKEDLYLEHLAEQIGKSPKYLSRAFRERTGIGLIEHIHQVRMERAKQLLIQTDSSVNDISSQVGIYSRTTFARLFKKYVGISPMDYRNINR
jgi:two-component system response regulator YesN